MYPLKFNNIYYDKIWGGRTLELYRSNLPVGHVGESWDLTCRKNSMSTIVNGKYQGMSLIKLIRKIGPKLIGTRFYKENFQEKDFPLLVKIINACSDLSVQVHPDDEYAKQHEDDCGKTEAWYIISSKEDSQIILGAKGCTKEEFVKGCKEDKAESFINRVKVKPGNLILIEPGMIHSIGQGILLLELQQNSDITYRICDYNRGRELQLDKAMEVINLNLNGNVQETTKSDMIKNCINTEKLKVDVFNVKGNYTESSDEEKFFTFTCVEGEGKIYYMDAGITKYEDIKLLDTVLIPANLGEYIIDGNMKLIKCCM